MVGREQPGSAAEAGCRFAAAAEPVAEGWSALVWVWGPHWCWPPRRRAVRVVGWYCCCSCSGWGWRHHDGGTVGSRPCCLLR